MCFAPVGLPVIKVSMLREKRGMLVTKYARIWNLSTVTAFSVLVHHWCPRSRKNVVV